MVNLTLEILNEAEYIDAAEKNEGIAYAETDTFAKDQRVVSAHCEKC